MPTALSPTGKTRQKQHAKKPTKKKTDSPPVMPQAIHQRLSSNFLSWNIDRAAKALFVEDLDGVAEVEPCVASETFISSLSKQDIAAVTVLDFWATFSRQILQAEGLRNVLFGSLLHKIAEFKRLKKMNQACLFRSPKTSFFGPLAFLRSEDNYAVSEKIAIDTRSVSAELPGWKSRCVMWIRANIRIYIASVKLEQSIDQVVSQCEAVVHALPDSNKLFPSISDIATILDRQNSLADDIVMKSVAKEVILINDDHAIEAFMGQDLSKKEAAAMLKRWYVDDHAEQMLQTRREGALGPLECESSSEIHEVNVVTGSGEETAPKAPKHDKIADEGVKTLHMDEVAASVPSVAHVHVLAASTEDPNDCTIPTNEVNSTNTTNDELEGSKQECDVYSDFVITPREKE